METDADLLREYIAGDETAFAELVHRHGPMVFAACLRILGSRHDAEDAFQATFVVLARRADSVRPSNRLAAWLHGVARRVALKARGREHRRRAVEARVPLRVSQDPSEPGTSAPDDLWAILDEELARLPARYLTPFVLCDLEGVTYREAAQRLGVPEGTLSNRLASARRKLANWLTQRGVALPAGGLAALLTPSTGSATVPPDLTASTVAAALAPDSVFPLAEGVLRAMSRQRFVQFFAVLVVVAGGAFSGASLLLSRADEKEVKTFEGEWAVIRAEQSGKVLTDDELKIMKVVIKDGIMTLNTGTRQEDVGIVTDPTTTPKSIDFRPVKFPKQLDRGIYKFDGDQLTICWGGSEKPDERQQEFKTTKDFGGRLLVLKKVKPQDK